MRKRSWKVTLLTLTSGGMMLQMTGCSDAFLGVTALSSAISAGGLIYLIARVLE